MATNYNEARKFIPVRRADLVGILPGRRHKIRGVFIHATRGGRKNNDDGPGTINWGNHPDNGGSFQDGIVGGTGQQTKCTRWEQDEQPLWAAGFGNSGTFNAQEYYIHIEVSQGTIDSPFTPESIESIAQWTGELAVQYNFPIQRIPFLYQVGEPPYGICDHENSANGRKLGKSDPGPLFPWQQYLERSRYWADQLTVEDPVKLVELEAMVQEQQQIIGMLMRVVCANATEESRRDPLTKLKAVDRDNIDLLANINGLNTAIRNTRTELGLTNPD